ncbi:MAG TPA: Hsp20/alpha crystallin family protein [Bacillota bacterium]|nr:Hsp20/alpha crystallin family protein [Bacillota bacterium]
MFELIPFTGRRNGVDRCFDDFDKSFLDAFNSAPFVSRFCTDIIDNGNGYTLEAELPGFEKKDISLKVENGVLTICAKHEEETKEKDRKTAYLRRERRFGSVCRSFDMSGIDESKITAAYTDGVLKIEMPKLEETKPVGKQITIE